MDHPLIPSPLSNKESSNTVSLEEYRKQLKDKQKAPYFTAIISGCAPLDELDDIIEDLEDSGIIVEAVYVESDGVDESDLPAPANDRD